MSSKTIGRRFKKLHPCPYYFFFGRHCGMPFLSIMAFPIPAALLVLLAAVEPPPIWRCGVSGVQGENKNDYLILP